MSFFTSLFAFFLILTPIILIHELGHFLAARLYNIKVDEFGLGFPPRAAKLFTWQETEFTLNWIPLGGFVRPAGEDDPNIEGGLASASKQARFVVLAAGSVFNYILAFFLFWFVFMWGQPGVLEDKVAISSVGVGTPAEVAGIEAGDIIAEVEGTTIDSFAILAEIVDAGQGEALTVVVDRGGELVTLTAIPRLDGDYDPATEGRLGIGITHPQTGEMVRSGPAEALQKSVTTLVDFTVLTLRVPAMLINGELTAQEARPVSVIGISQMGGQIIETSAERGDFGEVVWFMAIISVALGLTNLLPIPALDGGRLLFVIIEAVRGKRISAEREGLVHMVGMLILLGLMVLLMVNDIINPISF
ncbi:MAG TPA: M50 family metallopeptidase [Anaerolineae bacterium]|nr:M50 family metallopeptidase [Anaerolineae bacterium]